MPFISLGRSKCLLCGEVLEEGQDLVGVPPFIGDREHRLWRFHDRVFHRTCFLAWPDREEFAAIFNDYYYEHFRGMRVMLPDGTIEERDPRPGIPV